MFAERGEPEAPVQLLIGGEWVAGEAGLREVIDPATEKPMGAVALAGESQIDAAIAAADSAAESWRAMTPLKRGAILVRASVLLKERIEKIARLLTLEQGKTLGESRGEITRSVETLLWNGEEAPRIEGAIVAGRAPGHGATISAWGAACFIRVVSQVSCRVVSAPLALAISRSS